MSVDVPPQLETRAQPIGGPIGDAPRIAFIVSRFPKLTETFVLYEMLAVREQRIDVELYPLWRERTTVVHPEARELLEEARFQPALSLRILGAHFYFLRNTPRAYLLSLWTLLHSNFGSRRYFFGALAMFPKVVYFAAEMAARGVTHVHAHFASHPAAAAFVIHRLTGIPYSFTAHGSDLHRDRHMLAEKVSEAAFVVAISEYNRTIIEEECGERGRESLIVLHCGVDTDFFRPSTEPSRAELANDPFRILCVGTLHEVKGQAQLIEACRLLSERGVDFVCDLIGSGPDRDALVRQAARAGISDRIRFRGRATRAEIADAMRLTDLVVLASVPTQSGRREGIPVVLMEAGASGKPVVASRLSGIPELVEDGRQGCLVPPGDVAALADAIERLYRDPKLRARLGKEGRRKVLREFGLEDSAAELAGRFSAGARR